MLRLSTVFRIQDDEENYRYRNFYAQRNEKTFTYDPNGGLGSAVAIYCLSLDDFNRITGQNLTLGLRGDLL